MARQRRLPHLRQTAIARLDDDGVQLAAVVHHASVKLGSEAQGDMRQTESQKSARRQVVQRRFFPTAKKAIDLLVGGRAPKMPSIEIRWDQGLSLSLPR